MTTFVEHSGNLLESEADAIVNTVNTVGVMGKGIALQFKNAFPANFKAYERACKRDEVALGTMFVFDDGRLTPPHWIINFPTKGHWRSRSRMSDIAAGLDDLREVVAKFDMRSIALPPLGCGNGGLDWSEVRPLIERKLEGLDLTVELYVPTGAPAARSMAPASEVPTMTPARAALVSMLDQYDRLALGTSLIETQKLMYFLQEAGEDLALRFEPNLYGPYADGLRHLLKAVEGHYVEGFGDGSNKVSEAEPLVILDGALDDAANVLAGEPGLAGRMERVLRLVEGYASTYGLELLATVHWAATRSSSTGDLADVTQRVQDWNTRKAGMFTEHHIESAWAWLQERDWLVRETAPA